MYTYVYAYAYIVVDGLGGFISRKGYSYYGKERVYGANFKLCN